MKDVYTNNKEYDISDINIYDGKYVYSKKEDKYIKPWKTRIAGYDPARTSDRSIIAILDHCLDDKYRVISLYKMKNVDFPTQLNRLNRICEYCEVDKLYIDAKGIGGSLPDFIREYYNDVPKYPYISKKVNPISNITRELKQRVYTKIKFEISKNNFIMFRDPELIQEFTTLVVKESGTIQSGIRSVHDDIPSAIMIAAIAFFENKESSVKFHFLDDNPNNIYNNSSIEDLDGLNGLDDLDDLETLNTYYDLDY